MPMQRRASPPAAAPLQCASPRTVHARARAHENSSAHARMRTGRGSSRHSACIRCVRGRGGREGKGGGGGGEGGGAEGGCEGWCGDLGESRCNRAALAPISTWQRAAGGGKQRRHLPHTAAMVDVMGDVPACIDEWLDHDDTHMCSAAFNRWGTVLGAGCLDGTVLLWNMDTRGLARAHAPDLHVQAAGDTGAHGGGLAREGARAAHADKITALAFSADGFRVASGSQDGTLRLRDAATGKVQARAAGTAEAVTSISERPGAPGTWLVCYAKGAPAAWQPSAGADAAATLSPLSLGGAAEAPAAGEKAIAFYAVFSPSGETLYANVQRGTLLAVDATSGAIVARARMPGFQGAVKGLSISNDGKSLLVNSTDKIIRTVPVDALMACPERSTAEGAASWATAGGSAGAAIGGAQAVAQAGPTLIEEDKKADIVNANGCVSGRATPTPVGAPEVQLPQDCLGEFQNVVDRLQWRSVCFSEGGEYVAAAAAIKAEHHIYVWSVDSKEQAKVLEGPKEGVVDIVWHPVRAQFVSIAQTGVAYIWAKNALERWSAFAPDFKELVENEEYVEQENEFDICGEDDEAGAANGKSLPMGFASSKCIDENDEDLDIGTPAVFVRDQSALTCLPLLPESGR